MSKNLSLPRPCYLSYRESPVQRKRAAGRFAIPAVKRVSTQVLTDPSEQTPQVWGAEASPCFLFVSRLSPSKNFSLGDLERICLFQQY